MGENRRTKAYSYIRMSSGKQLKGNSLERQLELSRSFALANNLDLDEELSGQDIGISAFRGRNAVDGNLRKILEAIEDGRIAVGSWLIVESLDRLSRQDVFSAFGLFSQIINAGIIVATTSGSEQIYSKDGPQSQIWMMLGEMLRANDESRMKNSRGLANWAKKRQLAQSKKLTAMCPAWLKLAEDRKSFAVHEERAAVVRQIFAYSIEGLGIGKIVERLNGKVEPFGRSDGWHHSSVAKILNNRAAIGEFQPHKRDVNGRAVPEGDPIRNYFPVIVEPDRFYAAHSAMQQRKVSGRGPKGKAYSNLFSGLLRCYHCRRSIHYENKGDGPKGGKYLICEGARRNMGCERIRWRYDHFETAFLAFVEELDLGSLYSSTAGAETRETIGARLQAIDGELVNVRRQKDAVIRLIEQPGMDQIAEVAKRLAEHQSKERSLEIERDAKLLEIAAMAEEAGKYYESRENIKELVSRLRLGRSADLYKERAQIASRLLNLIHEIQLAPGGWIPRRKFVTERYLMLAETLDDDDPAKESVLWMARMPAHFAEKRRFFIARFRDGRSRHVTPHGDDPLQFHQMVVETKDGQDSIEPYGPFLEDWEETEGDDEE